ncbi:uncharacterized protein V6R79_010528 [Siganus canaliculatus]
MSEPLRRRSSSRQVLQNLIRVTAQRSQEDAEEVERERRRRSREKERREGSPSWPEPPQDSDGAPSSQLDEELKPSCSSALEEDEGFSDWSHRLENRTEQEVPVNCRAQRSAPQRTATPEDRKHQEKEEDEEEEGRKPDRRGPSLEASTRRPEKLSSNRKQVTTPNSSATYAPQDTRLQPDVGQDKRDKRPYQRASMTKLRADREVELGEEEEIQAAPQTERRSTETRQRPRDENDVGREQPSFAHEEQEDVRISRKEREEEQQRSDKDGGGMEESTHSAFSGGEDDDESLNCYGPMSPTFKKLLVQFYPDEANSRVSTDGKCMITERTESLRKSSSSSKKMPPVSVSKINKKLERYTRALEVSSKEQARSGSPALVDLMSPAEPVSSKKNLFEAGEAWNQNAASVAPPKNSDGIKVGVASLINQWVRESEDGSRCSSPSKPGECTSGKRYKFVVAGHGKYEKVSVDDEDNGKDATCQSAGQFSEDF